MSPGRVYIAVFGGLFLIYALTISAGMTTNDVVSADIANWRYAVTGRSWLDGLDLRAIQLHHTLGHIWTMRNDGHSVIARSPGVMVAAIPAYALAALVGSTSFSLVPGALTAAALTAAAAVMLLTALDGLVDRTTALACTFVFALATPMWSVAADGLFTHSITCFGLCGALWAARRERWWLLGVFGGVGLWGRLHVAVIVAIVGLGLSVTRRRPGIAVRVATPSGASMLLASLWSHAVLGTWNPAGAYGTPSAYAASASGGSHVGQVLNIVWLLASPNRGMLLWTPVLLVLLPAAVRTWRSAPDWVRLFTAGGLLYLAVQGLLDGFSGGEGFFGYRLGLETLTCAAPLSALAVARAGALARTLLGPVTGLQAGVFALGAVANLRPGGLSWHDCPLATVAAHNVGLALYLLGSALIGCVVARLLARRSQFVGPSSYGQSHERDPVGVTAHAGGAGAATAGPDLLRGRPRDDRRLGRGRVDDH